MAALTDTQAADLVETWLESRGVIEPQDWLVSRMVDLVQLYDKAATTRAQRPSRSHVAGDIVVMSGAARLARVYMSPRVSLINRGDSE